ncbi:L-asparaginase, type II [Klebsiella pneumoniae]|uniref:L-asparaginase, type II n=1 Tax=Klebsiella pneumoniae TaxID=573 RepID=A0A2X3H0S8_KLEPN|nr:L-asparaginase, type II [Klebsiella pneumoniae]
MAEYLVLYNSKRPHKSLELMTPVTIFYVRVKLQYVVDPYTDSLNPAKARILLMTALTQTKDPQLIQQYFHTY